MPGRREKSRCLTDVTVRQFADASRPHGRLAKPATDRRAFLFRLAAQGDGAEVEEADEEEEEEVFSEAAGTEVDNDTETPAADGTAAAVGTRHPRGQSRRKRRQPAASTIGGSLTYPALLWQILGGYVHPESVGTFAALCRDSRRVTRSRAFWRRLYLRWAWGPLAAADEAAPHELRISAILCCHQSVRPRVIRALHRWYFSEAAAPQSLPTGLRFLRFAVRGRRLLVLFRRGPPPPPPRPVPDCWESAVAVTDEGDDGPDQRCPTEGQWLLMADLEGGVCPPACLEELLALDNRYVLAGFRCLTVCSGGSGITKGGGRWCELLMRAPHGESRAVSFACSGGGGSGNGSAAMTTPHFLPWWRPGFLPALRNGGAAE